MTKVTVEPKPEKFFFLPSEKMEMAIVEITPSIARRLLDMTDVNRQRRMTISNIKMLQAQMEQGKWQLNGDAIRQDIAGNICDGQHRLKACINAKCNFTTLFVKGIEIEAMHTIDTGKNRSFSDVLDIKMGHSAKYTKHIAAIAKFVFSFDLGHIGTAAASTTHRGLSMDTSDFLEWMENNPDIFSFTEDTMKVYARGDSLIAPKLFCSLKWILGRADHEKADVFFKELSDGLNIGSENPVSVLRRRLLRSKTSADKRDKLKSTEQILLILRTWEAYINGKTIINLSVPKTLPEIKGIKVIKKQTSYEGNQRHIQEVPKHLSHSKRGEQRRVQESV